MNEMSTHSPRPLQSALDLRVFLAEVEAAAEDQKTACQPKPTAPLALSSSERRHQMAAAAPELTTYASRRTS